ncbi:hypothetical protein PMF13cell1_00528 [Blautia producta]|uniref:SWI2/SNF2 ATPase domain-containing protein n=1 Tax=Blautia producta TaxID=33035 RepID=A0A4P6LSX1_9FIRM|nr:hypothetical protein [Blautia producta]QBE95029.1 hypothetical protein PMF13cell1_00528 [Blautia producta]
MTGTPLIGDGYNTKDVFGNYIHKYYYNQSIADGYTLKLIREEIETTYKSKLAETLDALQVQQGSISKKELYARPEFVSPMVDYIVTDFEKGRTALDDSIGAMIVCDSAPQARVVADALERYKKYSSTIAHRPSIDFRISVRPHYLHLKINRLIHTIFLSSSLVKTLYLSYLF